MLEFPPLLRGHIRREQRTWSQMSYVSREPHGWMSWGIVDHGCGEMVAGLTRQKDLVFICHATQGMEIELTDWDSCSCACWLDHGNPCSFEHSLHGPLSALAWVFLTLFVEISIAFGDAGVIPIFCVWYTHNWATSSQYSSGRVSILPR
jgi:hypothetical protein